MKLKPQKLDHYAFVTKNPARLARFYTSIVGLTPKKRPTRVRKQGIIWLEMAESEVHLIPLDFVRDQGGSRKLRKPRHLFAHLAIRVAGMPSIEALEKYLKRRKVKIIDKIPRLYLGMWQVFVKDPDGNTIELIQPAS
jgi:catechol 2,3-dioxygenase-like lactoylglutathione lyase family enzyme